MAAPFDAELPFIVAGLQCHMPDAARYHRLQLVLAVADLAVTVIYLAAALATGAAHALALTAARLTDSAWLRIAIVALVLAAAHGVLTFAPAWARRWWLPRCYGLLHQRLAAWLGDRAKAALLGGAL